MTQKWLGSVATRKRYSVPLKHTRLTKISTQMKKHKVKKRPAWDISNMENTFITLDNVLTRSIVWCTNFYSPWSMSETTRSSKSESFIFSAHNGLSLPF